MRGFLRPAVLAHSGRDDQKMLRGIDFALLTEHGTRVRVSVRHALMLDEPAGEFTRCAHGEFTDTIHLFRETVIAPGDRVEVTGILAREVHTQGEALPGRGTPFVSLLRGSPGRPVLVRKLQ
jgi:hypothetical protein